MIGVLRTVVGVTGHRHYDSSVTLRRALGVLLWALVLHLNLVASDIACERHHDEPRATAALTPMSHMSHSSKMQSQYAGDTQSCKTPVVADCCRLMASCSVTFGFGAIA